METMQCEGEDKKDLDDSGCVQDVAPSPKLSENGYKQAELLDLSDDVLLYILRYCSPRDLKALGYTCPRLGRLIKDRTLWTRVDARSQACGRARVRWLLSHTLGAHTTGLLVTGYAREGEGEGEGQAGGCLGHVNRRMKEMEEEILKRAQEEEPTASTSEQGSRGEPAVQIIQVDPRRRLQRVYEPPRFCGDPSWPDAGPDPDGGRESCPGCPGPRFTLTQCMLRQLAATCSLTELALQYCNIDCNTTGINLFPRTLKKLSLRGSKCYNLPFDKSFLFNIQDHLPQLEHMDLSECEWLEPAALLPLSKVATLTHLLVRDCHRLSEFVAYASLATRYGFRKLLHLDLRGSPVADSEVSALGWLPCLEELYVSCASTAQPQPADHHHCGDGQLEPHHELDPWEMQEPEYFKIKPPPCEPSGFEEHAEQRRQCGNECPHGLDYNLCMDGIRTTTQPPEDECSKPKRKKVEEKIPTGKNKDTKEEASKSEREAKQIEEDKTETVEETNKASTRFTADKTPQENDITPRKGKKNINKKTKTKQIKSKEDDVAKAQHIKTREEDVKTTDNTQTKEEDQQTNDDAKTKEDTQTKEEGQQTNDDAKTKEEPKQKDEADSEDDEPTAKRKRVERVNQQLKKGVIWTGEYLVKKIRPHKDDQTPSCSKNDDSSNNDKAKTESDSSEDEDMPLKMICKKRTINEGASTSQNSVSDNPKCKKPDEHPKDCKCKEQVYEFVRFRQNMDPVIVRREASEIEREVRENRERELEITHNQNREVRPRAHVLYVNVGQQLHTVYRLSIHNEPPIFYSFARNSHLRFQPNRNVFYTPQAPHLDAASLVTDSAIRRFGRADGENIGYINIGTGGADPLARPNRSNLRILSVTGFRNITDRSLVHLATAAPHLRYIDFSETRVTAQGVKNFKSLRPDCEVIFSEYIDKSEN